MPARLAGVVGWTHLRTQIETVLFKFLSVSLSRLVCQATIVNNMIAYEQNVEIYVYLELDLFRLSWAEVATTILFEQTLHPRTVSNVLHGIKKVCNTPNRFPLTKTPAGHLLITAFSPTSFKKQTKKFSPPLAGLPEHTQIRWHQTQPGFLFNKNFINPQATNYPFRRLFLHPRTVSDGTASPTSESQTSGWT